MIIVLHSHVTEADLIPDFDTRLALLPISFHEGILKYNRQADRLRSLAAKTLLQKTADEFGLKTPLNYQLDATTGRPYFSNHPGFDFSLSHSGGSVICAASVDVRVGIDVEEIRDVELSLFANYFTKEEMHRLLKSPTSIPDFFKLWCAKEAISKADGRGVFLPFSDLEIKNGKCTARGIDIYLREISVRDGYVATLAFESKHQMPVETRLVDF